MTRSINGLVAAGLMTAAVAGVPKVALAVTAAGALTTPPSVIVFDQKLTNGAVDITYANIPAKGYLAVLPSDGKGMGGGEPLGTQAIDAGDHRNVKVKLTGTPKAGDKLWVSMYFDTDGKPGFDAKADKAVWAEALPAENMFTVK